jgi:hypothetical protein
MSHPNKHMRCCKKMLQEVVAVKGIASCTLIHERYSFTA